MAAKSKQDVIESIKGVCTQIKVIEREREGISEKLGKLAHEITQYRTERDALEAEQRQAASLLITGEMSDDQFDKNRQKLAKLYEAIDSATERQSIYQKALEQQSSRLLAELNSQLQGMRKILAALEVTDIAAGIAQENEQQIRNLAAMIHLQNPNQTEFFYQLGKVLAAAVFGESNGTPNQQDSAERNLITNQIIEALEA